MVKGGYDLQESELHKNAKTKKNWRGPDRKIINKRRASRTPKEPYSRERYLCSTKKIREPEDNNNTTIMSHGEPNLVRYAITDDSDDNTYGNIDHRSETLRRPGYAKKPKNPTDRSTNYVRTSSNGSPNNNLPTISENTVSDSFEMTSEYSSFRVRSYTDSERFKRISGSNVSELFPDYSSLHKFDNTKYFSRPGEGHQFAAKGTHPDSLYRVTLGGSGAPGMLPRCWRVLRWPAALLAVCVALALFIFYVMPDSAESELLEGNSTIWEAGLGAQFRQRSAEQEHAPTALQDHITETKTVTPKTTEFVFEPASSEVKNAQEDPQQKNEEIVKMNPVPVYPEHLTPDVQYGNEKPSPGSDRSPKFIHSSTNDSTDEEDSTLKNPYHQVKGDFALYINKDGISTSTEHTEHSAHDELHNKSNFTSGHSKFFGIAIEDAERFEATTANSLYNARYSPTLPALTHRAEHSASTTARNSEIDDGEACRSTSLDICRRVLPYDLASAPVFPAGIPPVDLKSALEEFELKKGFGCGQRALEFICHLLEPECTTKSMGVKMPCMSFCIDSMYSCSSEFGNWTLSQLANCQRYGDSDCIPAREPCHEHEFSCGDDSCINELRRCDGVADCANDMDERDCSSCNSTEWSCSNGDCVPNHWLCDGYADCPEGDDEENCRAEADGFFPHPGKPQDVPKWFESWMTKHKDVIAAADDKVGSESRLTPVHVPKTALNVALLNNALQKPSKVDRTRVLETAKMHDSPKDADSRELLVMSDSGSGARRTYPRPSTRPPTPPLPTTNDDAIGELLDNLEKMVDSEKWWETAKDGEGLEPGAGTAHASPCPAGELRCVDGRCIMFSQLCDGHVDCTDSADEDNCHA